MRDLAFFLMLYHMFGGIFIIYVFIAYPTRNHGSFYVTIFLTLLLIPHNKPKQLLKSYRIGICTFCHIIIKIRNRKLANIFTSGDVAREILKNEMVRRKSLF